MDFTAYVAGFMLDLDTQEVALIRKNKPAWQAGKLNAIGGKIESGEAPLAAMIREFEEETAYFTKEDDWRHFAALVGSHWCCHFFVTVGHLISLESPEEEKVEIHDIALISQRQDVIENIPWLLALAIDAMKSNGPTFVTAQYP
jgi:8-oxo-dGTP diphosphatase